MHVPGRWSPAEQWSVWPAADLHCFYARFPGTSPPIVLKAPTMTELRDLVLACRAELAQARVTARERAAVEGREAG